MSSKENRKAPRTDHDSVMEIYDVDGNFIVGVGRLVNFSSVGVCFSSTKVLAKGERLRAKLRLLKEGALEVSARIVWAEKKSNSIFYGMAFDSIQKLSV